MFQDFMRCSGMFCGMLWDVFRYTGMYRDVQGCSGDSGMFWGFWDVLVILGCYGDSGMFLDVLGYTGMY